MNVNHHHHHSLIVLLSTITIGIVGYELYRFDKERRRCRAERESAFLPPVASGVLALIGNTPMIEIVSLSKATGNVYVVGMYVWFVVVFFFETLTRLYRL
jgi:hypothetical protein